MSFPIAGPPLTPNTERLALRYKQGFMQSPHSGAATVISNYAEWQVELGFSPTSPAAARELQAWRNSLKGSVGTFLYSPQGVTKPLTGRTLASTAFAMGDTLVVAGWTASAASGLVAGDMLSIGNALFEISNAPASADGSGHCTLTVSPPLREDLASASAVEFVAPTVKLRLVLGDSDAPGLSRDPDAAYVDNVRAVQAL